MDITLLRLVKVEAKAQAQGFRPAARAYQLTLKDGRKSVYIKLTHLRFWRAVHAIQDGIRQQIWLDRFTPDSHLKPISYQELANQWGFSRQRAHQLIRGATTAFLHHVAKKSH